MAERSGRRAPRAGCRAPEGTGSRSAGREPRAIPISCTSSRTSTRSCVSPACSRSHTSADHTSAPAPSLGANAPPAGPPSAPAAPPAAPPTRRRPASRPRDRETSPCATRTADRRPRFPAASTCRSPPPAVTVVSRTPNARSSRASSAGRDSRSRLSVSSPSTPGLSTIPRYFHACAIAMDDRGRLAFPRRVQDASKGLADAGRLNEFCFWVALPRLHGCAADRPWLAPRRRGIHDDRWIRAQRVACGSAGQ